MFKRNTQHQLILKQSQKKGINYFTSVQQEQDLTLQYFQNKT